MTLVCYVGMRGSVGRGVYKTVHSEGADQQRNPTLQLSHTAFVQANFSISLYDMPFYDSNSQQDTSYTSGTPLSDIIVFSGTARLTLTLHRQRR